MPFIGKQPTAVPLTSSDITDGIVTTAKIADDAVDENKLDLTANYAFTGTISGAGGLIKLHSITTTDATTSAIDFDSTYITSTYDKYLILGSITVATDTAGLYARFSESGTFQTGASYYGYSHISDTGSGTNDNDASFIDLSDGMGNATGEGGNINLYFHSPTSSTISTHITHHSSIRNSAGSHSGRHGASTANTSTAHDGIRFYPQSGNFASGTTITLYGVVK